MLMSDLSSLSSVQTGPSLAVLSTSGHIIKARWLPATGSITCDVQEQREPFADFNSALAQKWAILHRSAAGGSSKTRYVNDQTKQRIYFDDFQEGL